jgi:hypothetical protein
MLDSIAMTLYNTFRASYSDVLSAPYYPSSTGVRFQIIFC